jgi:hypothetical protein
MTKLIHHLSDLSLPLGAAAWLIGIIILRAEPPRGTWDKTNVVTFVSICRLPNCRGADAPPDDGQSDLVC